jgi:hypothetical protein
MMAALDGHNGIYHFATKAISSGKGRSSHVACIKAL